MSTAAASAPDAVPLTEGFKLAIAWTCASLAAIVVALAPLSASFVDQHYLPIGPDSFYHARRILDAAAQPGSFYQFDALMHAPEGSLVIWPWAYDYVMSLLVRAGLAFHLSKDPLAILVHLPVLAFPLALALMLSICRNLQLSVTATALAMLCTALFPLNQSLYGIGNIDHHFAEQLFVLGTLAAGLAWLRHPQSALYASAAGAVFAMAPGVHTSLFVLQIPLLATLGIMWMRRMEQPRSTTVFAGTLVLASLALTLPSLALREGRFEYFTLSWFQVYAAGCTAALAVAFARVPRSTAGMGIVTGLIMVLLLPLVGQISLARDFFTVSVAGMEQISEVQSLWQLTFESRSPGYVTGMYTAFIWLAPVAALGGLWRLWHERDSAECLFWITALVGLTLLCVQLRLQYFGSFALYMSWILLLSSLLRRSAARPAWVWTAFSAIVALAYAPGVRAHIFASQVPSGDPYYAVTRTLYISMQQECAKQPGVMLANPDDGHYIRFNTRCAVIGNNFLITPQHVRKVLEERALLKLPASEALARAPYVRYVYVRRDNMFFAKPDGSIEFAPDDYPTLPEEPLVRELLTADTSRLPRELRLVNELKLAPPSQIVFARLFAVEPRAAEPHE